jgi:MscS family membrane protein
MDIILGHGAEVAFPTSTIHVPDGLRVAPPAASEGTGTDGGGPESPREA